MLDFCDGNGVCGRREGTHIVAGRYVLDGALGAVANLVVEAAGAVTFAEDGADAVGHPADLTEARQVDLDGLVIVLICRVLLQCYGHAALSHSCTVAEVHACDCEVDFLLS